MDINKQNQPKRITEIVQKLKESDVQGLTFATAKQDLLAAGYSEEEITDATYQFPYDAKPDAAKPVDLVTALFKQDPQAADQVAQNILAEQKKDRETVAIADDLAADMAPDLQSSTYYENKFLADVGMSWWLWLLIEIIIGGAIYFLHLPEVFYAIIIIMLSFYIIKKYA